MGIHVRFTGRIQPADFARLSEEVTSDERFDDLRYALGDFRDATGHDFDLNDRNAMTAPCALLIGASHTNGNIHAALVITDPGIIELMQRSIAIGVLACPIQIFDQETAATRLAQLDLRIVPTPRL